MSCEPSHLLPFLSPPFPFLLRLSTSVIICTAENRQRRKEGIGAIDPIFETDFFFSTSVLCFWIFRKRCQFRIFRILPELYHPLLSSFLYLTTKAEELENPFTIKAKKCNPHPSPHQKNSLNCFSDIHTVPVAFPSCFCSFRKRTGNRIFTTLLLHVVASGGSGKFLCPLLTEPPPPRNETLSISREKAHYSTPKRREG